MALVSSQTTVQEEAPSTAKIPGVATNFVGAIGTAVMGPINTPVLCTSYDEYKATFGGFGGNADLAKWAWGFFAEGGIQAWFVRIVHYSDISDATTKTSAAGTLDLNTAAGSPTSGSATCSGVGPYIFTANDTLIVAIDALGDATATFTATAAARESAAGVFALSNNQTLTLSIDGGAVQTIVFTTGMFVSIGAATAAEVAAAINGQIVGAKATVTNTTHVTITSDRQGTGSGVNITGGSANGGILAFTVGNVAGTGNVSNIKAVTVAEIKTVVELAVAGCVVSNVGGAVKITSNTTGVLSIVQVKVASTLDTVLGFDNAQHLGLSGAPAATLRVAAKWDGAFASAVKPKITAATNGDAARFDFLVMQGGIQVEIFANVSMLDTDPRYVETVVNDTVTGSKLVAVTDLDATAASPGDNPAVGLFGPLTGGADGLGSLADTDYIGSASGYTGLHALDKTADVNVLAVPDRASSAVHNAMLTYAQVTRELGTFCVLDPPASQTALQMKTYADTTAGLTELSSFGAMFWPRTNILNPSAAIFGAGKELMVPPSALVCAVINRGDEVQGGVYRAPAGATRGVLRTCTSLETNECLDKVKRDLVVSANVNPLNIIGGQRVIDDCVTLKMTDAFPTIPERRGAIFIEQSVKKGVDRLARLEDNDDDLRAKTDRAINAFLNGEMAIGAFRSQTPKEAYFVDVGTGLNTVETQFAGRLTARIGIATQKPARFVILKFGQDTRALDQAIAQGR